MWRYFKYSSDVHSPKDILRTFWGDLRFEAISIVNGKTITVDLAALSEIMFDESGAFPPGLPVNFEEPTSKEIHEMDEDIRALFEGLRPAHRRDSIVLTEEEWKQRTDRVFDESGVCRCLPVVYVSHLHDEEFWGIYYNIDSILYHFFMDTDEEDPRTVHPVFLTAYALVSAYRGRDGTNGLEYIHNVGVKAFTALVWAEYLYFWTNYVLTHHVLEDIYTARGDLDAFVESFRSDDATNFSLLVALQEGKHLGVQALIRPLLDPLRPYLAHIHRPPVDIMRTVDLAVFLSSYALLPIPQKDPFALSDKFLNVVRPYWSAFWVAHTRGVGDPLLLKSGRTFRGVRAFVKELKEQ